ncbi:MAG: Citrate transporter, partial [Acidimicrobiales bacterium]|nr:Citrate transporter [Acidimicrobiales bacterium]
MPAARILLLAAAIAGAVGRPWKLPAWTVPSACLAAAVVSGTAAPSDAARALRPLAAPIGFLLCAVPLAILLDRLGFFASVAERVGGRRGGSGGLWVLAAVVTTVLNLDAAVVLLTPLYVQIARRTGRDPLTLAFQPVLLACLASAALPVSNLTNLIAASWTGAGTAAFVLHLGLPSLAATSVGWLRYRSVLDPDRAASAPSTIAPDASAADPGRVAARPEARPEGDPQLAAPAPAA